MKLNLNYKTLAFILGTTVALSSCHKDEWGCKRGHGSTDSEERIENLFNKLEINIESNVFITQDEDAQYSTIRVKAQENIIDEILTEVDGNEMVIEFDNCVNNHKDINIYITLADLNKLEINGSSDVYFENTLETNYLDVDIDGSGDITLDIEAISLNCNIDGSGDISIEGSTVNHDVQINGSGDISAFGLITENTEVVIKGSGDCEVRADEILDISIAGSGNVYYKGYPSLSVNIIGSGDVVNVN